jgi:predicted MPP superfamily phosphohydrolase
MSKETPDYHRELERKRQKQLQKITRREWIKYSLLGGTGVLASAGYLAFEAQWLEVCEKEILLKGLHPKSNLRVLHLSDLHLSRTVPLDYLEKALQLGLQQSPDLCFLTGDFVTDQPDIEQLKNYANLLKSLGAKVPTFACMGNHDGGKWAHDHGGFSTNQKIKNLIRSARIEILENERKEIHVKGQRIDLVGVGDLWSENCRPQICMEELSTRPEASNRVVFLLNHNPDAKDALIKYRWDLMLSGHTHGGQFKVPFDNRAPFAPVKDGEMIDGTFSWKGRVIHITRGIGNLYGIRLNCRPEISLLKISGLS